MKPKQKISVEPLLLVAILIGVLVAATHAQDQVRSQKLHPKFPNVISLRWDKPKSMANFKFTRPTEI